MEQIVPRSLSRETNNLSVISNNVYFGTLYTLSLRMVSVEAIKIITKNGIDYESSVLVTIRNRYQLLEFSHTQK